MQRSSQTLELHSTAHSYGDSYYRRLNSRLTLDPTFDEECLRLAVAYLQSLEEFSNHLRTVAKHEVTETQERTTKMFIELIRKDIELNRRCSNGNKNKPARETDLWLERLVPAQDTGQ